MHLDLKVSREAAGGAYVADCSSLRPLWIINGTTAIVLVPHVRFSLRGAVKKSNSLTFILFLTLNTETDSMRSGIQLFSGNRRITLSPPP
jgi:hypothetical protein